MKPPARRAKRPEDRNVASEASVVDEATSPAAAEAGAADAGVPPLAFDPLSVAGPAVPEVLPAPLPAPRASEAPHAPANRSPSASARPDKASDEARIAKVMARAGLCSRRDAEAWIADGRVAVNGRVIESPALNVRSGDAVTVDGYPIDKPEKTRLFLFNKARGLVTTSRDPEGRPTIYDALPPELPRLVTIGRLDINTEGLLLLTNDGGLARLLELPATGWIRRYRVRANGTTDQAQLDVLAKGLTIDGVVYAGIAAKLDRVQGANVWLTMGLKEGKNREIKRVLEHLGLSVTRLIRISFGPFQLGELGDNAVEEVRTRVLRDQLGTALAKQAGVDFDGPEEPAMPVPAAPGRGQQRGPQPRAGGGDREAGPKNRRAEALPEGPRRQVRRGATEDRRGRAVTVERITTAGRSRTDEARTSGLAKRDRSQQAAGRPRDGVRRDRDDAQHMPGAREAAPRGRVRPDGNWSLVDEKRRAATRDAVPRSKGREEAGGSRQARSAPAEGRPPQRNKRDGVGRGEPSQRPGRNGTTPARSGRDERPSRTDRPRQGPPRGTGGGGKGGGSGGGKSRPRG